MTPLGHEKSTLKGCLKKLRELQNEFGDRARTDGLPESARAIYFEIETRLSRALGELDWLANQKKE